MCIQYLATFTIRGHNLVVLTTKEVIGKGFAVTHTIITTLLVQKAIMGQQLTFHHLGKKYLSYIPQKAILREVS